ncbi:hypothetical protein TrispH2_002525 [Trichoplax sp. H2]|nr:hypothetical protein TrispH2_002525 [Trichoplax sp. H2]|eukprot:RDD45152.1 hypothetical protein TrispH2_002525 [Trichoplax sp. H2]
MYTAVGKKKQLLLALTSITDCMENCTSAHATTRVYSCRTWLEFGQYESGIQQISSLFHSFPFRLEKSSNALSITSSLKLTTSTPKSSSKMFEDEAEDMAGQESGDSMSDLTEDDLDFDSDGITYIFDSDFCRTFYKNNSWIEASYLCDDNNQEQDITKDYLLDEFDLVTKTLQTSPSHKDIISRLNTLPQIVQLCNDHVFKEPFCGNRVIRKAALDFRISYDFLRDEITEELLKLIRKSDSIELKLELMKCMVCLDDQTHVWLIFYYTKPLQEERLRDDIVMFINFFSSPFDQLGEAAFKTLHSQRIKYDVNLADQEMVFDCEIIREITKAVTLERMLPYLREAAALLKKCTKCYYRHTTEAYRNAIRNNIVEVLSSVLKIISFLSEESQELLTFDAHGIRLQHTKKDIRQALASIPCHRIFEILKTMDLQLHDQALLTLTTIFTHVKDRKQQQFIANIDGLIDHVICNLYAIEYWEGRTFCDHLFIFLNNLARYNNNMIQKLIVNDVVPFIFSWIDVTCEHFHPPTEVFHTIVVCGTNKQVNELIKRENVFKEACELITGCHDYEVIKYLLLALNVIVQKCKQLPKLKKKLKGDVLDAIDTTMEYYRGYGDKGPDVAKFRKFLETGRIKKK